MADYCAEIAEAPERLARPEVQKLTPYQSARRIVAAAGGRGDIWLNANESAESVPMALQNERFNRYPEPQPEAVVEAYASYAGVSPEQILVTRGGDEGIELLVRTFCRPGEDAVLQFPPTYGMYAVSAETNGAKVINLITAPDRGWVPDAAEASHTLDTRPEVKLVFACSPGNPTGTLIPMGVLRKLAQVAAGRALLVIDEAYIEFSPADTAVDLLKEFPHVVIIRTLSKAFALAGLRCGFLLSSPGVIGMLKKVIAPYPIPSPVADLAAQALTAANSRLRSKISPASKRFFRVPQISFWRNSPTALKSSRPCGIEGSFCATKTASRRSPTASASLWVRKMRTMSSSPRFVKYSAPALHWEKPNERTHPLC